MSALARRRRPRLTVLVKLLVAFILPTTFLFALFAVVAHQVMRRDLEAELGTRLAEVAASAATQIRGHNLVELEPGDEQHLLYLGARRKLLEVAAATRVARLYIFDPRFRSRADTKPGVPIGATYYHVELDRQELRRVWRRGQSISSSLFEGLDGRLYKAGYAPIYASDKDRTVVLAVGVDAPATFFDRLADLRHRLLFYGLGAVLAMVLAAVLVAARITRPVRTLAGAAERIGAGDLDAPVARTSHDEIGLLADTMEQMRRDLLARDQRLQQMLSGIAHEVRNPLGGIELFAGILRDEIDPDDERRPHVDRIDREVGYLKQVVAEFLDYARRPALELGPVTLASLCADIVELEAAGAAAAGVALSCDVPDGLSCRGDAGQLRRAVHNLVKNAIQAAGAAAANQGPDADQAQDPAPPAVTIAAASGPGDSVSLSVANTGRPIPPEVQEHMFEPFFTTREKGTGLGLAFVREIALDHGGEVEVASSAGAGTTFTLRLCRA